MECIYEQMNMIDDEASLNESAKGQSYKGYVICYGCHETDRWYVKDGWNNFIGTVSGYSTEKEAKEFIDSLYE